VKEPYIQVLFQLRKRLTRGLRGDALGYRRLAEAAQLSGSHKGGNRTEFVDGHGAHCPSELSNQSTVC
jgi:hypothetical protein